MPKSKTYKVSPRKTLKRKRENSAELRRREASEERRKRLSSEEASRRFFNTLFRVRNDLSKQEDMNRLNKELKKNKNESMNLLRNQSNKTKGRRKITFKGLGNPLGIKI